MKRADVIAHIRIAGYHSDQRSFLRLYTENRISSAVAKEAFAAGARQKEAGVPCHCYACSKLTPRAT